MMARRSTSPEFSSQRGLDPCLCAQEQIKEYLKLTKSIDQGVAQSIDRTDVKEVAQQARVRMR